MVKIIYAHPTNAFQNLKIAGDFSKWNAIPMHKKSGNSGAEDTWEVSVDLKNLPDNAKAIHFKFIDDSGSWFTDDNYPKEVDGNSNENNVKVIAENEALNSAEEESVKESLMDDGPASPVPSLNNPEGNIKHAESESEAASPEEDEESVGGPAVVVNHSDAEEAGAATNEDLPKSSGTVYSTNGHNPEHYKDILARIIAFFTNLFRNWFS